MSNKNCFGILENVFPVGKDGLREVVSTCFECPDKTACLKSALDTKEGINFQNEIIDRNPSQGLIGRIKRWSEKKELSRNMKQIKGKNK